MQQHGQRDVSSAKRKHHMPHKQSSNPRSERQRTQPLRRTQIDRSRAIDAIKNLRQLAIGPQQTISPRQFNRPGDIGKLQAVLRESVPHIAHGDEPTLYQSVEQALDHFAAGDPLWNVLGHEADFIKRRLNQRTNGKSQLLIGAGLNLADQFQQPLAVSGRDSNRRRPVCRRPQILRTLDCFQQGKLPPQGNSPQCPRPAPQIKPIDAAFMSDTDLLQVIKNPRFKAAIPEQRPIEQRTQSPPPIAHLGVAQLPHRLQPLHQ